MCRWIAYSGETIPLEQYVTAPAHSLIVQSVRALESTASTNGDGFGLGLGRGRAGERSAMRRCCGLASGSWAAAEPCCDR